MEDKWRTSLNLPQFISHPSIPIAASIFINNIDLSITQAGITRLLLGSTNDNNELKEAFCMGTKRTELLKEQE